VSEKIFTKFLKDDYVMLLTSIDGSGGFPKAFSIVGMHILRLKHRHFFFYQKQGRIYTSLPETKACGLKYESEYNCFISSFKIRMRGMLSWLFFYIFT
jgi:hypothetical protein